MSETGRPNGVRHGRTRLAWTVGIALLMVVSAWGLTAYATHNEQVISDSGVQAASFDRPLKFTETDGDGFSLNSSTDWCVTIVGVTNGASCVTGATNFQTWQEPEYTNLTWSEYTVYSTFADNYWFNSTPYEGVAYTGTAGVTVALNYAFQNESRFGDLLEQSWLKETPELNYSLTTGGQALSMTLSNVVVSTSTIFICVNYLVENTTSNYYVNVAAADNPTWYNNGYSQTNWSSNYLGQGYTGPLVVMEDQCGSFIYPYEHNSTAHDYRIWVTPNRLSNSGAYSWFSGVLSVTVRAFGFSLGTQGGYVGEALTGPIGSCWYASGGHAEHGPSANNSCGVPETLDAQDYQETMSIQIYSLVQFWQEGSGIGNASLVSARAQVYNPYQKVVNTSEHDSVSGYEPKTVNTTGYLTKVSAETGAVYTYDWPGFAPSYLNVGQTFSVSGPARCLWLATEVWIVFAAAD